MVSLNIILLGEPVHVKFGCCNQKVLKNESTKSDTPTFGIFIFVRKLNYMKERMWFSCSNFHIYREICLSSCTLYIV